MHIHLWSFMHICIHIHIVFIYIMYVYTINKWIYIYIYIYIHIYIYISINTSPFKTPEVLPGRLDRLRVGRLVLVHRFPAASGSWLHQGGSTGEAEILHQANYERYLWSICFIASSIYIHVFECICIYIYICICIHTHIYIYNVGIAMS